VQALGKTPIVVNDSRGFFTSRVFGTFVMEARRCSPRRPGAADRNAALAAGMPVGPLAVLDETSLALSVTCSTRPVPTSPRGQAYEASRGELLVERMVKELKRPGRAAGGGFYDYPAGSRSGSGRSSSPCSKSADGAVDRPS
jgi:3-hydroxyacyl-CoA dehydrogenase/enoyl-CoA hydratase/3-hydroxybutyryl-CoA epimerase